ncbi:NHL domain-containing protein [Motilibacter deserti]|uniref:Teneurin NHL domain-containing protein n=1 Tax=Motilibacter deserti TaxID=2714956 RepID=A0ABX0GYW3_9ACTN|nr:hypothetical protein [Motilibacter deserti]NHC14789.1 hypothetical protein [Motilibacter deserti]
MRLNSRASAAGLAALTFAGVVGTAPAADAKSNTGVGVIRTIAGTGAAGYTGDGAAGTQARISNAEGAVLDRHGRVWIADTYNNAIRRVELDGSITTVVPPAAGLLYPFGLALKGDNVYVADTYHHRVVKLDRRGRLSVVAGSGTAGYAGDGGRATAAQLRYPFGVDVAPDGRLLIADTFNNRVREVGNDGVIRTIAGSGARGAAGDGGTATEAQLALPYDVADAPGGATVIADTANNRVREVDAAGVIRTIAGTGVEGYNRDGIRATDAQLAAPSGVDVAGEHGLVIADYENNRVRLVQGGTIRTVAGDGTAGSRGDGGSAAAAAINIRGGVSLDRRGRTLVVVDTWSAKVRLVPLTKN